MLAEMFLSSSCPSVLPFQPLGEGGIIHRDEIQETDLRWTWVIFLMNPWHVRRGDPMPLPQLPPGQEQT